MIAWIMGYDVPEVASEKQLHARHLCMCMIRSSKIKLRSTQPIEKRLKIKPKQKRKK